MIGYFTYLASVMFLFNRNTVKRDVKITQPQA
jgi:hypothetical protein